MNSNNLMNYESDREKLLIYDNDNHCKISIQLFFMSSLYLIYCFYIFTFFSYTMNIRNGYFNKLSSIFKINIYETLWNILNVYSYCYIKISNSVVMLYINYINTKICTSIKSLFFVINDKITIDIIYKGESILTLNACHNLNKQMNDIEYDFILYKNNETQYYKIITKKDYNLLINDITLFSIQESNIKFFVVCIQLYNNNSFEFEKYNVNLNHFMVVNNELLKEEFVVWYLNYYYKKKYDFISNDDLYYKIEIIDHNVNKIIMHPGDFIHIEENNYTILNYNKN